jgi:broad specificity phosphatase PhoE
MAALYLIRHGQASFTSVDYDQLSPLGYQQTALLGQHWRTQLPAQLSAIGYCYQGTLKRHQQSAKAFTQRAQWQPKSLVTNADFNEIDHHDILACFNPRWQNRQHLITDIKEIIRSKNAFQPLFNQALLRWVNGEHNDYKETWQAFKARVINAFQLLITQLKQRSGNIMIFTSAGPISVILQHVLQLNTHQGFALNNQVINSSVTKLLYSISNQHISLDYFNNYSHLEIHNPNLITYR